MTAVRPEPTGVRFVLGDCTEPGREAELDAWYDAYAADCTRPGLLVNAVRYARRAGDGPRYAAVYDIVDADPGSAWPQTNGHPARQFHTRSPLLSVALKSTYRRIEPLLAIGELQLPAAIAIVLRDGPDDAEAVERVRAAVGCGGVTRATRYALVEGEPDPPGFLELYESDHFDGPALELSGPPPRLSGVYVRTFAHT
jgi:hypothetical protein